MFKQQTRLPTYITCNISTRIRTIKLSYIKILGISAFYHDSAASIICDNQIIAAAQEERFTRIKHDESFPTNAVKYCLKEADEVAKQFNIHHSTIQTIF